MAQSGAEVRGQRRAGKRRLPQRGTVIAKLRKNPCVPRGGPAANPVRHSTKSL